MAIKMQRYNLLFTFLGCTLVPLQGFLVTRLSLKNTVTTTTACFLSPQRTTVVDGSFPSAMPLAEEVDVYRQMGIEEGRLALGVDPKEFVTYLGTREDLVSKTMADIPSFDRAKAEAEVDKFLMDSEALNMYIQFQKKKAEDPDFTVPEVKKEEEGLFSFRTVIIVYLLYVAYDSLPKLFRRWVADREATGEWQGSGISWVDDWISKTPVETAVQAVSDAVQTSLNAAQ